MTIQSKYLRFLVRHFLFWTPALIFWTLLREVGNEVTVSELTFPQRIVFHLIISVIAALIFGSLDYTFERYIYKRMSFGKTLLIGVFTYLAAIILLVTLGLSAFTEIRQTELNWAVYTGYVFSSEMVLLIFYLFIIGFIIDFIKEVDKKFGPGNLWKMIKGEFYHPKEENRIFMFLDLKSSTTIAEKLGHQKYSQFIQRCFQDVSDLVVEYQATIYQYVGDEIVLTWTIEDGLSRMNCIRFYFAYRDFLRTKKDYYESRFGLVPEFKAGLEMGRVMVAEVGEIKREIAYHGDVLNTAARIQGCCNEFGKGILISENLEKSIEGLSADNIELMGDIQLKGKNKHVRIFAINEKAEVA